MKRILPVVAVMLLAFALQSCNKRCQCVRYDGGIVEFTPEELEAEGKTCAEKIYYQNLASQYYSLCEWQY